MVLQDYMRNLINKQDLCLFVLLAHNWFFYFIGTKKPRPSTR